MKQPEFVQVPLTLLRETVEGLDRGEACMTANGVDGQYELSRLAKEVKKLLRASRSRSGRRPLVSVQKVWDIFHQWRSDAPISMQSVRQPNQFAAKFEEARMKAKAAWEALGLTELDWSDK